MAQQRFLIEEDIQRRGENLLRTGACCFALGAGLMYILDPNRGRRRRKLMRDKLVRSSRRTGDALRKSAEYMRDRAVGIAAETRGLLTTEEVSDERLCARVRSAIGRAVSHPRAIEVRAHEGVVTLEGTVLSREQDRLLATVASVRGVRRVESALDVHKQPRNVPSLQGGAGSPGRRYGIMQQYWSPAARWMAGAGAGALIWQGLRRGGVLGGAMGLLGAGLAARAVTNLPSKRLTGIAAGRRAVDIQKTINIAAPVDRVFGFFANYANFPHFMRYVREVRDQGTGRSHWRVAGPAGLEVEWDADLTEYIPNELIAWRSVEGTTVENAGIIHFDPNNKGGTRVHIQLSYNPPGGALGHAVARLLGADPKSEMDADLARVKTLLETGHPAHDAAQPIHAAELGQTSTGDRFTVAEKSAS